MVPFAAFIVGALQPVVFVAVSLVGGSIVAALRLAARLVRADAMAPAK